MSENEEKPLKERVTDLEKAVQPFTTKLEHGGAKADIVGATGAVTGLSAEFTGIGTGVKLWNAELDVKAELERRRDEAALRDPKTLRSELTTARSDIRQIRTDLTSTSTRIDERVTDLSTELNRKISRKADISALRQTADRHDSRLEGLRSSQVNALRREAHQTRASVQALEDEIDRLNARF